MSLRRVLGSVFVTVAAVAACGPALADQVVLKNGDRITGKIVSADGGKLKVTPDFAKSQTLELSLGDVATFTSETPVVLKLKDGSVINQPILPAAAGEVLVAPGGALASQTVAVAQIDKINPAAPAPPAWHGTVGANGLYSDANTSALAVGFSASAARVTAKDTLTVNAAYNYGEQTAAGATSTNANNWALGAKYDYNFLTKAYGYVSARAAADQVNELTLRFTPSVGAGYRWIDEKDFHLTSDAGLSWIYEDYRTNKSPTESLAVSVSYHVDKSWDAGRISVFHDMQLLPSVENGDFLAITDLGLRTALTKTMYSEIRVDATYDSAPPPLAKSTTTQLKIGLGWTY